MNLPNWLTSFRVATIPFVALLLFIPYAQANIIAAIIFILASITDGLDGWLARKLDKTTGFGAFLDPVADKLLVCVVLIMLVYRDASWYMAIIAAVIIGREIAVSALREWMASRGKRHIVAVDKLGKYKTATQMTAIIIMLFTLHAGGFIYSLGVILLIIAAFLAGWSMYNYLRAAWPEMHAEEGAVAE